MTNKKFRLMFIYLNEKVIGCLVFFGDGTYIDHRMKLRIGVSKEFEYYVFELLDSKYVTLFQALEKIDKTFITERKIIDFVNSKTDFKVTHSVVYEYPYHKLSAYVFKNVLKNNGMVDFNELRGEENL